jgi:hypothetical protein
MCKPGSVGGLGGRPPSSTRPGFPPDFPLTPDFPDSEFPDTRSSVLTPGVPCHESAKTTKLYDRREDEPTLDEVERNAI